MSLTSATQVASIELDKVRRSHLPIAESQLADVGTGASRGSSTPMMHYGASLERCLRAIVVGGRPATSQGLITSADCDATRPKYSMHRAPAR